MSTSVPADAPAVSAPAQDEKPLKSPKVEVEEVSEPTETGKRDPSEAPASRSSSEGPSEGEYSGSDTSKQDNTETVHAQPPLPNESIPEHPPLPNEPLPGQQNTTPPLPTEPLPTNLSAPPLPTEPAPEPADDGWEFHWNPNDQSYWFYNRFTGVWQQENPRVAIDAAAAAAAAATTTTTPTPIAAPFPPTANLPRSATPPPSQAATTQPSTAPTTKTPGSSAAEDYNSAAFFNRRTGQWQTAEQGTERHSDEAKARRQMRAFFDVDAAANMHDGRSLKAERAGIKPSRSELKAFKERRKQRKEERRRAWLRD